MSLQRRRGKLSAALKVKFCFFCWHGSAREKGTRDLAPKAKVLLCRQPSPYTTASRGREWHVSGGGWHFSWGVAHHGGWHFPWRGGWHIPRGVWLWSSLGWWLAGGGIHGGDKLTHIGLIKPKIRSAPIPLHAFCKVKTVWSALNLWTRRILFFITTHSTHVGQWKFVSFSRPKIKKIDILVQLVCPNQLRTQAQWMWMLAHLKTDQCASDMCSSLRTTGNQKYTKLRGDKLKRRKQRQQGLFSAFYLKRLSNCLKWFTPTHSRREQGRLSASTPRLYWMFGVGADNDKNK